ncbi:hypothetical protein [Paenibacillus xerothermodurans]|uniref:Polymerase nucleotidyl transferase domain-containing protein n=1 Tax=Paenibacillus xerothermodurans TaxID=1977292 RepID=A0A2W1NNR2_PAEXE|nr:hypothetical protein [Paenibacillus xerothermodurans]PZE21105.1 hypothetical protein CBW46_010540 [Paenibacillus xerothermodurans]
MTIQTVGAARAAAAEWVMQNASKDAAFRGAYFSGSTVGLSSDAELPPASDIDVVVVTAEAEPPLKLGKFIYRGTLIEVTFLTWRQLSSTEEVLTNYHLAGSFRIDTIISDPTGRLSELQRKVSRQFAERDWVQRRCHNVLHKIESGLHGIDTSAPMYDQVTAWLFPTGVTTHVLLVAALRNPTVRLRYLAAREVLNEYGHDGLYPELLQLLGCADLTRERAAHHLTQLAITFDAAAAEAKTPFFFSTDITAAARPIAIDGSRELIQAGDHRETVFWTVATFSRCHKILAADSRPQLQRALSPAFEALLADLGIVSTRDLIRRAEDVRRFLPRLRATAEQILAANPHILTK